MTVYQTDAEFADHPVHPYGCYFLSLLAALQPRAGGEFVWQLDHGDVKRLYDDCVADGSLAKDCTVQSGSRILNRCSEWIGTRGLWEQLVGQTAPRLTRDMPSYNEHGDARIVVSKYSLKRPGTSTWHHFMLNNTGGNVLYDPWVYEDGTISRTRREGKLVGVRIYRRLG